MNDNPIDRIIELPQGETTVRDIPGPPGAPALLLLHGLGATGRLNWGRCYRPLSHHFRVISVDHRGHGKGLRTRRFKLAECADDAVAAAEALGVKQFISVGYSMGGPIASLTWHRHPEQVMGLVLCATSRHFASRRAAQVARATMPAAAQATRLLPSMVHRVMLQRMLNRIQHPELREYVHGELSGHEPATIIQAANALTRFSSHDWIGDVDVPTAVIITTRDELVPVPRQVKLAQSIPGAMVFEVEDDHDACVREVFPQTLVEACRAVAAKAK